MTRAARAAASAALLAMSFPAGAHAAPATKPLRTITFAIDYTMRLEAAARNVTVAPPNAPRTMNRRTDEKPAAPQPEHYDGFRAEDPGTLQVDVVAATGDGGLVVDATYTGKVSKQPALRVAIYQDGTLAYDPKQMLAEPAKLVLPMLARGLMAGRRIESGESWSAPVPAPAEGQTTYRIEAFDGVRATMAMTTQFNVKGPRPYEQHEEGTVVYAVDLLTPVRFDVTLHQRRYSVGGSEATDSRLTANLVSDTFTSR